MNYDVYKHDILSAITAIAESRAMEATLTWDGANNYRVQPAAKYTPLDSDHKAILTRADLESFCDGDLSADALQAAVGWVESNQREWFSADEN